MKGSAAVLGLKNNLLLLNRFEKKMIFSNEVVEEEMKRFAVTLNALRTSC